MIRHSFRHGASGVIIPLADRRAFRVMAAILALGALALTGCLKRSARPSLPYVKPAESVPNVDPSRVHMASRLEAVEQELGQLRDSLERLQATQGSREAIRSLRARVSFIERQLGIEQAARSGVTDAPRRDPAGRWQESRKTGSQPAREETQAPGQRRADPPPAARVELSDPPQDQDEQAYRQAYGSFRKGRLDSAIKSFEKFVKEYPKSKFTSNAVYWLGEALYNKGRHAEAVLQFDRVIKEFPSSKKVASAYLKQGQAFQKMGDTQSARIILEKLIKEYPHTAQGRIAKRTLKSLSEQ